MRAGQRHHYLANLRDLRREGGECGFLIRVRMLEGRVDDRAPRPEEEVVARRRGVVADGLRVHVRLAEEGEGAISARRVSEEPGADGEVL